MYSNVLYASGIVNIVVIKCYTTLWMSEHCTKMCRDGVTVLWCRSHLVFEGSIPTCTCFHSENFFVTCWILLHVISNVCTCKRVRMLEF